MKLTKSLLVLTLLSILAVPACNPGCVAEQAVVHIAAEFTQTALQCANESAIETSYSGIVSGLVPSLCAASDKMPKGPLANAFCPVIAQALVGFVAVNGIPAAWGCTAANASALVESKLQALCEQLPVSTSP